MRRLAVFAGLGAIVAIGCGGTKGSGAAGGTGPGAGAGASSDAAAETPAGATPDAAVALLTDEECARMADHMLDVQLEEKRAAGEELPDPGAVDEIRRQIKADFVPECRTNFEREVFDCWMGARSRDAFESCAGGPPPPQE